MQKKLLIVDDIDFNLEFEKKVIISLMDELKIDVKIDMAQTVKEAIDKIHSNIYDTIITDMNLPDGSGVFIAKAARDKDRNIRIAALTIYPSIYEKERSYFDLFLRKPIMPDFYKKNLIRLMRL